MFVLLAFIFGTIIGSFLNVVTLRLPHGERLGGRSHCPRCRYQLTALDLVPLASFLFLRGRCRSCHAPISWRYPLVELLTGALFAFALLAEQAITPHGVLAIVLLWVISAACIVTFIIDFEHYLILNTVTFWATVLVILVRVCLVLFGGRSISQELYSGGVGLLVGVLPLYALWFLSRGRWIGFGDVKFMFFAGIALGWPGVLIGLLFSYWLGALVAVPLLIFGRKTLGSKIPFGTFLAVGVVLAAYFATPVWEWYWQLLA